MSTTGEHTAVKSPKEVFDVSERRAVLGKPSLAGPRPRLARNRNSMPCNAGFFTDSLLTNFAGRGLQHLRRARLIQLQTLPKDPWEVSCSKECCSPAQTKVMDLAILACPRARIPRVGCLAAMPGISLPFAHAKPSGAVLGLSEPGTGQRHLLCPR